MNFFNRVFRFRQLCLVTTILAGALTLGAAPPASSKGKVYRSEHKVFTTPESGLEVIQLTTDPADDSALYFTGNSFVPEDNGLIFASRRTGAWNLFYLNLKNFTFVQLTDGSNISGIGAEVCAATREVFFRDGKEIKAVHLKTLVERTITTVPEGYNVSAAVSVTAAGDALAVAISEIIPLTTKTDVIYSDMDERFAKRPWSAVLTGRTDGTGWHEVARQKKWISHVLINPRDAGVILYCHEGKWDRVEQRMWLVNADGTGNRPLRPEETPELRIGHEFWFADGLHVGYQAQDSTKRIGVANTRDGTYQEYVTPFSDGHVQASPDGKLFVGDGSDRAPFLNLYRLENGRLTGGPIHRHGSSRSQQHWHPHPAFSPDGKFVIFTSSQGGNGNVYLIRTAREQVAVLPESKALFPEAEQLHREVATLGKAAWRPMLGYAVDLHVRSTHAPEPPFALPWEEIGPGYGYGPAFGHWDVIHQIIDVLPSAPEHARQQLLNNRRLQLENGYLPGVIWMPGERNPRNGKYSFDPSGQSHPPVWVVAADDYMQLTGDRTHLREFYDGATRQIVWFEQARAAEPAGFYYNDIRTHKWESGVDEGVRFDGPAMGPLACIDATSQVYQLCDYAAKWARLLGEDATPWSDRAGRLRKFINTRLWDQTGGFYYDVWAIDDPAQRTQAFEGLWPLIVGAAQPEQAQRIINDWLLDPQRFLTKHPIPTVGAGDPKFEQRMWRGPAWNSMTYWVARGCVRYGRPEVAARLLEAALDNTAAQFDRTGTIWEFFHSHGGRPEEMIRKPHTWRNQPWRDYLGHNPVLAMTRLWQEVSVPAASAPKVRRP